MNTVQMELPPPRENQSVIGLKRLEGGTIFLPLKLFIAGEQTDTIQPWYFRPAIVELIINL
jgi:hypothetical protein